MIDATLTDPVVAVGEPVIVNATIENAHELDGERSVALEVDDVVVATEIVSVDGEEMPSVSFTESFDEAGVYAISVNGTAAGDLTVEASDSDEEETEDAANSASTSGSSASGSSSAGSSSAGSSSGGSSSDRGSSSTAGPTTTRSITDGTVTFEVAGASGDPIPLPLEAVDPSDTEPAVSLSALVIDPQDDRDAFEATIAGPSTDPGPLPAIVHGEALAYVDLRTDLNATETTNVTLRFNVDEAAIPDGLDAEAIEVLRYADDEWTTAAVRRDVDGNMHTVTLPHISPVVVAALEPGTVEVVEAEVPAGWVSAGHATTVLATIRNPGDRPETRTMIVAMDDETVSEHTVTLQPGATETIEIEFEPTGSGAVLLDGTEAGGIAVGDGSGDGSGDDSGDAPATADGETDTVGSVPGFGVLVAAIAVLMAMVMGQVLVGRRRRP